MPADMGSGIPDEKPPRVAPTDGKGMFGGAPAAGGEGGGPLDTIGKAAGYVTKPVTPFSKDDDMEGRVKTAAKIAPMVM